VASWLSPSFVDEAEGRIREIARSILTQVSKDDGFDIVNDLSNPYAARVTLDLMGLGEMDWTFFARALFEQTYIKDSDAGYPDMIKRIEEARRTMKALVTARRPEPQDDFIGILIKGRPGGRGLDDDLIEDIVWQVMGAGFETTSGMIQHIMMLLSRDDSLRDRLVRDPAQIPAAIEEFLRYFSPATTSARTLTADCVVGGVELHRGDRVLLCWGAANTDPSAFPEPDRILIDRSPNRHLAFGEGVHLCVGARLGRLELKVMLEELLTSMPRLDVYAERAVRRPSIGLVNSYLQLPGSFGTASV
jgi:cytochrome P450